MIRLSKLVTWRRISMVMLSCVLVASAMFMVLDKLYPMPKLDADFARVVVDKDGMPLRAFANEQGIWRYEITYQDVSKNYLEALFTYEDRWFDYHPGVNPVSLVRAFWQNIFNGEVVSGGSTLTMQVARLLVPNQRTLKGKLKQMFRALQLEWHHSKEDILNAYLNYAPFGGTIEGVQAASFTYFGKSASLLSDAEAALLAVLPQAPSRNRPDRYPEHAKAMRDKVLHRMHAQGIWSTLRVEDALLEPVWTQAHRQPQLAPLLSRRLAQAYSEQRVIRSTIDTRLQQGIADLVQQRSETLPAGTSAAVLVMENHSLAVRAYVGSVDFNNAQRFGHVDMITAMRSPGSTLKPFLYGMAMDDGLIHSQSLLVDAPSDFGDYRPQNFDETYRGPVSVSEALQASLNVPAIQVLAQLGEHRFMSGLKNAGMIFKLPRGAKANLALGLGGVGTTLESLVSLYSALANEGYAGKPRLLTSESRWQRRVLSDGAAWIVRDILASNQRSDRPAPYLINYRYPSLAWKTGTSYGFRDSWAVGVTADYTLGVWIGRPDGTPLPGYYGAIAAAPLLFTISDHLPKVNEKGRYQVNARTHMPDSVMQANICWPLGGLAADTGSNLCHRQHQAWLLQGNVPLTFSESDWAENPIRFAVNAETQLRVDASCAASNKQTQQVALWPQALEPWLEGEYRRVNQVPDYDPSCEKPPVLLSDQLKITGIQSGSELRAVAGNKRLPSIELQALGGYGKHYWFVNGKALSVLNAADSYRHSFKKPGRYVIAVVDEQGGNDEVEISVHL